MNKKPGLLFAVCMLAIIILAASFGMNFGGNPPVHLRSGINPDNVLYVCPVSDYTWDTVSVSLKMLSQAAYLLFFFSVFILLFSWGWALYQNLLKDKFSEDVYKNPWGLTKVVFWMAVVYIVLAFTPNHFRRVDIRGAGQQYVLCENTSTGARPVNYKAVRLR